jgi:hypothetical protein
MKTVLRSFLLAAAVLAVPTLASAQTTIQGQIIIQEAQPQQQTVAPQAQVYAQPQPQSVYVAPTAPAGVQCPPDTIAQPDRFGRTVCMREVTRHRVSGGLLGGGIGMFVGGWVLSGITGLVVGVAGAVSSTSWATGSAGDFITWSWIPILGPWANMAMMWRDADPGFYAWLAFEGLLQAGGLTMLIFGAIGEDVTDYEPIAGVDLHLRPILGMTTQGIEATLNF